MNITIPEKLMNRLEDVSYAFGQTPSERILELIAKDVFQVEYDEYLKIKEAKNNI